MPETTIPPPNAEQILLTVLAEAFLATAKPARRNALIGDATRRMQIIRARQKVSRIDRSHAAAVACVETERAWALLQLIIAAT